MKVIQKGWTLVELMVAVGILAVIAAFALPAYVSYTQTAENGQLVSNISTMRPFQEDFFLRNGNYAVNLADIAAIESMTFCRQIDGSAYRSFLSCACDPMICHFGDM